MTAGKGNVYSSPAAGETQTGQGGGGYVGSLQVAVLVMLQGRNARGGSYGGWRRVGYWLTGGRGGVGGGGGRINRLP